MTHPDKELDALITEALDAEDRDLLGSFAKEPGFFTQAFGIFSGSLGWVMVVVMGLVFVFIALLLWTGWHLFNTDDVVMSIRWGVATVISAHVIIFLRSVLMMQISTNRVLREVKRLELQIIRTQHRESEA